MKLTKAIEILLHPDKHSKGPYSLDFEAALKLGAEGLKWVLDSRREDPLRRLLELSGETQEN